MLSNVPGFLGIQGEVVLTFNEKVKVLKGLHY